MPQKYLTIGGLATLVHHRGPTTLPGSPPRTDVGATVVCLHDAGGNGNNFAELMDHLGRANSPLAFDRPGHGRSGGLDSLGSVPAMVDHLTTLADTWDLERPVLVGEGLGAAIALDTAAARPGWASAIVAVGGVGPTFDVAAEIEQLAAITAGKARREFDRSGYAPETDRSVYQRAFGDWVKTDPRATLGDRRAQAEWSCPTEVSTPVLVVVGEHEDDEAAGRATALAQATGGSVARLAGAGRHGVLEQPAALAALIQEHSS